MNTDRLKQLYETSKDKYGDARKMGTTYQTMWNIINKQRPFQTDLLERIAAFYGVPVGYFFDEADADGHNEDKEQIKSLQAQVEALKDVIVRLKR